MGLEPLDSEANAKPLTKDDIASGLHGSFQNAEDLLRDARLLRDPSPGRSLSLAVLAIEELGKIVLLAEEIIKVATIGSVSWPEIRKKLTSHRPKQAALANYGRKLLSLKQPFYKEHLPPELAPLLDRMKQWGFYVDWTPGGFLTPSEFGQENSEWVDWLMELGEERVESLRELHGTLEASRRFVDRGSAFFDRMASFTRARKPATDEDLASALRDFVREEYGIKPNGDSAGKDADDR